jgi:folate-binding protein YgfZ
MHNHVSLLPERSIVCVRGPDWRQFLQGLLSQDVEGLKPAELRYAAFLTPQGKMFADMMVFGVEDGCYLDVHVDAAEALLQRLLMHRLRSKVDLSLEPVPVRVRWGETLTGPGWTTDPRFAALGQRSYAGSVEVDSSEASADWRTHRFHLGIAETTEAGSGEHYPIELNLDLLNGIDFHKGCFVGQETTSRMKRRGQIKNRVLPVQLPSSHPVQRGDEILNGSLRAGQVIGVHGNLALGLIRLDRLEGPLVIDALPVTVLWPSWMEKPA